MYIEGMSKHPGERTYYASELKQVACKRFWKEVAGKEDENLMFGGGILTSWRVVACDKGTFLRVYMNIGDKRIIREVKL
jgi:hypothetical protein